MTYAFDTVNREKNVRINTYVLKLYQQTHSKTNDRVKLFPILKRML